MVLPIIFICSEHVFIVDMGQYIVSFYHMTHYKFQSHHLIEYHDICDWAYENRPCECKLHRVIFSPISFVLNFTISCRRKPIKFCNSDEDFIAVA